MAWAEAACALWQGGLQELLRAPRTAGLPAPVSASLSQAEAALQKARVVGAPGPGVEPARTLAFPGLLILPLGLGLREIPEVWVRSHGQGTFEVMLSERVDRFFPPN